MGEPVFNYDEASDTLYVAFEPGEKATGIELNDHILMRINKREHKAIGLTFFNYSVLAQRTAMGRRSFPASGLAELSPELLEIALDILQKPPISLILSLFAYTPSYFIEPIPITALQSIPYRVGEESPNPAS
jgi:uncharacterized protein YuzE